MTITNSIGLPYFIYKGLVDAYMSHSEPKENEVSTTTINNKPTGMIVLDRNHKDDIVIDVQQIITSAIGTILHGYFEMYAKDFGLLSEKSVTRDVKINGKDYEVTGRFDFFDPKTGELFDLKSTKVATYEKNRDGRDDEWFMQGMSYAEGIERTLGYPVKKFTNVCLILDYSAMKKEISGAVQMISHDMTTPEAREYMAEILDFQNEKLKRFDDIRDFDESKLPMCTPEERWEDQSWAVMKEGRKSAVRCFDTEEEAEAFYESLEKDKNKHSIVERKGNPRRCLNYCNVKDFCPYYRNNLVSGGENEQIQNA